jgi:hypothetical protein
MAIFTPEAALALGSEIASRKPGCKLLNERTYTAFYGRTPTEISDVWEMCNERIPTTARTQVKHLFWALMYMKLYCTIDVMCVLLETSKPTLDKWVWLWIETIAMRHVDVVSRKNYNCRVALLLLHFHSLTFRLILTKIDWGKRHRNVPSEDVWCRVSVDGTDFMIGEPFPFNKKWKSPKFSGAAVKYEVAISIFSGDIVWINGPHRGGKNDITIFVERLRGMLEDGEMIEADAGYKGHAGFIRSKADYLTEEERMEKSELRARHETVNRRFKSWGILKQQFRNDKKKHEFVFYAIAVLTQLSIDNGSVLFACEPITKKEASYYI